MEEAEEQTDFRKLAANLPFAAMVLLNIFRELTFDYCFSCFIVRIFIQLDLGA